MKGEYRGDKITIYMNKKLNPFGDMKLITSDIIAYLKEIENDRYEMSMITRSGGSVQTTAFSSLGEARRLTAQSVMPLSRPWKRI